MKIDVTIGYKVVEDGKPTRYFGDQTENGVCYKDLEAFKDNSDLCYIPECELDGENWSAEFDSYKGYTREEILSMTKEFIEDENTPADKDFVEHLAEHALQVVDWQSIETYLNEIDIYETWEYFKGIKS